MAKGIMIGGYTLELDGGEIKVLSPDMSDVIDMSGDGNKEGKLVFSSLDIEDEMPYSDENCVSQTITIADITMSVYVDEERRLNIDLENEMSAEVGDGYFIPSAFIKNTGSLTNSAELNDTKAAAEKVFISTEAVVPELQHIRDIDQKAAEIISLAQQLVYLGERSDDTAHRYKRYKIKRAVRTLQEIAKSSDADLYCSGYQANEGFWQNYVNTDRILWTDKEMEKVKMDKDGMILANEDIIRKAIQESVAATRELLLPYDSSFLPKLASLTEDCYLAIAKKFIFSFDRSEDENEDVSTPKIRVF